MWFVDCSCMYVILLCSREMSPPSPPSFLSLSSLFPSPFLSLLPLSLLPSSSLPPSFFLSPIFLSLSPSFFPSLPSFFSLSFSLSFFLSLSLPLPSSTLPPSFFISPIYILPLSSLFPVLCLPSSLISLPHSSPDTSVPTELITLHNHEAKHIACGDDHTAILTAVNTQMVRVYIHL